MTAVRDTQRPYELGQQIDPSETTFVAKLEDLPDGVDLELARRMRQGLWESDRLADDVVAEFSHLQGGTGWRMLDRSDGCCLAHAWMALS